MSHYLGRPAFPSLATCSVWAAQSAWVSRNPLGNQVRQRTGMAIPGPMPPFGDEFGSAPDFCPALIFASFCRDRVG
jgi:hypothetical protein